MLTSDVFHFLILFSTLCKTFSKISTFMSQKINAQVSDELERALETLLTLDLYVFSFSTSSFSFLHFLFFSFLFFSFLSFPSFHSLIK